MRPPEPVDAVVGAARHAGVALADALHVVGAELLLHLVLGLEGRVAEDDVGCGPGAEEGVVAAHVGVEVVARERLLDLQPQLRRGDVERVARLIERELLPEHERHLRQLHAEQSSVSMPKNCFVWMDVVAKARSGVPAENLSCTFSSSESSSRFSSR